MTEDPIRDALQGENARALLRVAAEEARRRDRGNIYTVLQNLGSVGTVAFSDEARTARLRLKCGAFRIEFSRRFVEEHVKSPADLLHLLLHEVLHKVRGDLRRPVPDRPARALMNFAADMLVDADIETTVLGRTPDYFRGLYPRGEFPANLLLPPWMLLDIPQDKLRGLSPAALERRCAAAFRESIRDRTDPVEVARIYLAAWRGEPSFEGLLKALRQILPAPPEEDRIVWLGDHSPKDDEDWQAAEERLREWLHEQGGKMAGQGDESQEEQTEEKPADVKSRPFYEAVRRAIVDDPSCPRSRETLALERGVIPFVGRREAFLIAAGWWPAFFRSPLRTVDEDERRVHVYVDVSGSTNHLWGFLYGLVLHLGEEIGDRVHLFSNKVEEATLKDLRRGRVRTTGGTDFDCVAEHALAHRHRRILIVTDGEAALDGALERQLKSRNVGIFLILTEPNDDCPLLPLARKSWLVERN